MELTSAKLRYLLTVAELQESLPHKVRCIDIAVQLGVARPSACRMLAAFCREGLLHRGKETGVRLTEVGKQLASCHLAEYRLFTGYFAGALGLSPYDAREAAMALLVSAPDPTRTALSQAISHAISGK